MKKAALFLCALLATFLLALPSAAYADAGGFSGSYDYDFGSSWDYGSSWDSWDSGSSWDYGSSWDSWDSGSSWDSGGSYSYTWDDDNDDFYWGGPVSSPSDTYYEYDYDDEVDEWFSTLIGFFIFCLINVGFIRFIFRLLMVGRRVARQVQYKPHPKPAQSKATTRADLMSLASLKQRDPSFDEAAVEERIANIYVKMQQAWTAGDFEPVRPYFNNNFFAQLSKQLDQLNSQGLVNYVDNIAVLGVTILGWKPTKDQDILVARVHTRINDYTVNKKTGKVVQGSKTRELFMEYEYTLVRPAGTQTFVPKPEDPVSIHCPNCGAALDEGASAKCKYCGSVINLKPSDWVVSAIKGISQQTSRK